MKTDKYVGLDVHKVDTQVVIAADGRDGEVRHHGKITASPTCYGVAPPPARARNYGVRRLVAAFAGRDLSRL